MRQLTHYVAYALWPHVAAGDGVSSRADHGRLDGDAPPVAAAAHAVLHHGQQGLLEPIRYGAMSCGEGGRQKSETRTSAGVLTDEDITVKVPPARDVTRGAVSQDLLSLWKTGRSNAVIHDGALVQLQQGQIVSVGRGLMLQNII